MNNTVPTAAPAAASAESPTMCRAGNVWRIMREAQRLTQRELAEQSGTSRSYLSQVETGVRLAVAGLARARRQRPRRESGRAGAVMRRAWRALARRVDVPLPGGFVLIHQSTMDAREDNAFIMGMDMPEDRKAEVTVPRRRSA